MMELPEMDRKRTFEEINGYLYEATTGLASWLNDLLPRVAPHDWWQKCVLDQMSQDQFQVALNKGFSRLEQLDLAALLRITNRNWYAMQAFAYLPKSRKECVKEMLSIRNRWAHHSATGHEKNDIIRDLETILEFFRTALGDDSHTLAIKALIRAIQDDNLTLPPLDGSSPLRPQTQQELPLDTFNIPSEPGDPSNVIKEKDTVFLVANPETKGMVFSISEIAGTKRYEVFVNGGLEVFYEDQIQKVAKKPACDWIDLDTFRTNLTAYEINNPSAGNLYSLNAARIDFVPYQFKPALKMIKADEPRILIADSVGVGKTIEAGLLIKELEARGDLESILIICPKPLVAERKWELEMRRFDEDFIPLDGRELRQALSDAHRDEEWPQRFKKAIIPYSILDERAYQGIQRKRTKKYGLLDLDPPPHFDLVIIDEAHHIRNGSMASEKAFAYKCVQYFCEHSDAVVMLTATPLQTSNDDLYTLLNLLRPDIVLDKDVFHMMAEPNPYIYQCSHAVRIAEEGWEKTALEALERIPTTTWGKNVTEKDPIYQNVLRRLQAGGLSREDRVKLISQIESLHSFNMMLSRTRRKDIQDFCVRKSETFESDFTPEQAKLHDELLHFEAMALSALHDSRSISFMMTTIKRQAASCIFGLAPHIEDIISRRLSQLSDDLDVDSDDQDLDEKDVSTLEHLARNVIKMAKNLPGEDPKFDSIVDIIAEKQKAENNKIMIFSSFRHTLHYLHNRIEGLGYRVAQIDGSVKDDDRQELRARFELQKEDPDALDILLFTEVGSEGLDYQFCDTMINYDLPWNPMRIEQRIGRIDRRGQKSEAVHIYNVITKGTVDADIFTRCLDRIGIFKHSIGECEEVLGAIATEVEKIAVNAELTPDERREKLQQISDNEIRRMQVLSSLEDQQKNLFGFDLSNYIMADEIEKAESPWLTSTCIQRLVERYLEKRLGPGEYFVGSGELKQIRLSRENRQLLLEDSQQLRRGKSGQKRKWELYLKDSKPQHSVTFLSETAAKNHNAFFLTPLHPLVKQAAAFLATNRSSKTHLRYYADNISKGKYPFAIYKWNYIGMTPTFKIMPVCTNSTISKQIIDILQEAESIPDPCSVPPATWDSLEANHVGLLKQAEEEYSQSVKANSDYKKGSITGNYLSRKNILEHKIQSATDVNLHRMFSSQLQTLETNYTTKINELDAKSEQAGIHTAMIAQGVIEIV